MNSTEPCAYRVSVKGIVVEETGKFLLCKEENGYWELLGGGLEHDEDPVVCLEREISEETGLTVTWVSPNPKYFVTAFKTMGHKGYAASLIYEIKLSSLEFKPSDECVELKFFSVEEAKRVKLYPNVKKFLEVFDPKFHWN